MKAGFLKAKEGFVFWNLGTCGIFYVKKVGELECCRVTVFIFLMRVWERFST